MAQIIALTPLSADVARALATRGRRLLALDNPEEVVPALLPLTLYFTLKELGLDEAAPLLRAASDDQRQHIVDLECWDHDEFIADELDAWLAPFAEAGHHELAEAFLGLDEEVQVLFLQQSLRIIDHRALEGEEQDRGLLEAEALTDVPEGANHAQTPDGHFTVFDLTRDREVPPLALLDALVREPEGAGDAYRLLTAARTELPSPLCDEAYQFRNSRMEELGFRAPAECASLFAPPARAVPRKPSPLGTGHATALAPGAVDNEQAIMPAVIALALRDPDPLFSRALAAISDSRALRSLEAEWMGLVNAALVGWGQKPKDVDAVANVALWVRDALGLGLEALLADAGQNASAAAAPSASAATSALVELILTVPLAYVFQRGMECIRPLAARARQAAALPAVAAWLAAFDEEVDSPEGLAKSFVRNAASPRPLWAGQVPHRPRLRQLWQRAAQLRESEEMLKEIVARITA